MHAAPARSLLGLAAILALAATLIGAIGLLAAAPAVLAFALLYCGRYPGVRHLDRAIAARQERRSSPRDRRAPLRRSVFVLISRGGGLIASSLAKRPPPQRSFAT